MKHLPLSFSQCGKFSDLTWKRQISMEVLWHWGIQSVLLEAGSPQILCTRLCECYCILSLKTLPFSNHYHFGYFLLISCICHKTLHLPYLNAVAHYGSLKKTLILRPHPCILHTLTQPHTFSFCITSLLCG